MKLPKFLKSIINRNKVPDDIAAYYFEHQRYYNRIHNAHYGPNPKDNLLERGSRFVDINILTYEITRELERIKEFKATYPGMQQYLFEGPVRSIENNGDYLDENGFVIDNKEVVLKVAMVNYGYLRWMPSRFAHDSEVLLAVCLNNSIWHANRSLDFIKESFPELTDEEWECEYESENPPIVRKLIGIVKREKPFLDLYELVRDSIDCIDFQAYMPYANQVEDALNDEFSKRVFMNMLEGDTIEDELNKLNKLRIQAKAVKLDQELSHKPDGKKKKVTKI